MTLITGGTGFIGMHLLERLAGAGAAVRALVRPRKAARALPAGVEAVYGDLATGEGIDAAIAGADTVIHLAGATKALAVLLRRRDRALGIGLGAVFLVLFVHSLFYAGFFEDPLTWGVLGVAGAVLAVPAPVTERAAATPRGAAAPPGGVPVSARRDL